MTDPVYQTLRKRLDQYSIGFPSSPSGVELAILEKLFTPDEADLFLELKPVPEAPQALADRTGRSPETVARLLAAMAQKGTVFCLKGRGGLRYAAVPFVLGIYEFQAGGRMTPDLAALFNQYFEEALLERIGRHEQLLRPIPVNRSIATDLPVTPYEDARQIVQAQSSIAVTRCLCREEKQLIGQGCAKPLEVCLLFGPGSGYFVEKGQARMISTDEALGILDLAEEHGLVHQPTNSQQPEGMCNCCGDCCAQLRALNRLERPADLVMSNYVAAVDSAACSGCGACLDRCQMGAISLSAGDLAAVNPDRCIGCGLCVTICPTEALRLQGKPRDRLRAPAANTRDHLLNIARRRGLVDK